MEGPAMPIRGLINDLTRTLTGSLVHMDDLLLRLSNDSEEFDDAWLANHQLERALEFFIELRSEYIIREESINQKKIKYCKFTDDEKLLHDINNLIAVVVGYCDMIQNGFADVHHIGKLVYYIYKYIQSSNYLLNDNIRPSEWNVATNGLYLSIIKTMPKKATSNKKYNGDNKILLIEDNEGVRDIISTVLHKYKYTVICCSKGETALSLFEQYKATIELCVVDVGLPDINGPDLVDMFLLMKPNIKILFTTGYNETELKNKFSLIGKHLILIKPFRIEELLNKIRTIIIH